jgi:hypothetical protein
VAIVLTLFCQLFASCGVFEVPSSESAVIRLPAELPPEPPEELVVLPKDSDGDGLSDDDEVLCNTDPENVDTDEDGLGDLEECKYYSDCDPTKADTDADYVPDGDEYNASQSCVAHDFDNDGFPYPSDCNDNDAEVYPGAPDPLDGEDRNCQPDSECTTITQGFCMDAELKINGSGRVQHYCMDIDLEFNGSDWHRQSDQAIIHVKTNYSSSAFSDNYAFELLGAPNGIYSSASGLFEECKAIDLSLPFGTSAAPCSFDEVRNNLIFPNYVKVSHVDGLLMEAAIRLDAYYFDAWSYWWALAPNSPFQKKCKFGD